MASARGPLPLSRGERVGVRGYLDAARLTLFNSRAPLTRLRRPLPQERRRGPSALQGRAGKTLLLCGALVLAAACAAPADSDNRPAAQRTADARLRVLTSGNPAVPLRATATPLPAPTCPGAIWWFEAGTHVGERATVQGPVAAAHPIGGGLALDLGQAFPDPNRAVARLQVAGTARADAYAGKTVCVTGSLSLVDGVPTMDAAASEASVR